MIVVSCQCGARYRIPEKLAGKRLKCKKCAGPIDVPAPDPPEDDDAFAVDVLAEEPTILPDVVVAGPAISAAPAGGSSRSAPFEPSQLPAYLKDCVASLMFFAESGNLLRFLVVGVISMIWPLLLFAPCIGPLALIIVFGWIFSFLFNVLLNAANGERDLPEFTLLEGMIETVIVPFFKFLAAFIVAFVPLIVYGTLNPDVIDQETPAYWLFYGLGVFLWPMAMLMVGIGGVSSFARIDLMVRTLIRSFVPYVLVCALTAATFTGSAFLTEALFATSGKSAEHPVALSCALQPLQLYFWVLVMRFIGLYYHHFKSRFAWTWG